MFILYDISKSKHTRIDFKIYENQKQSFRVSTQLYACITNKGVSVWNSIRLAILGFKIRARIFRL